MLLVLYFCDADLRMINLNDVFGVWGREAVLEAGVDCDTQALDLVLHLNMEWDSLFEFGFRFSFLNLLSDRPPPDLSSSSSLPCATP